MTKFLPFQGLSLVIARDLAKSMSGSLENLMLSRALMQSSKTSWDYRSSLRTTKLSRKCS